MYVDFYVYDNKQVCTHRSMNNVDLRTEMDEHCLHREETNNCSESLKLEVVGRRSEKASRHEEHATAEQVVVGSNSTEAAWKVWQFPLPHFASVFRKRH